MTATPIDTALALPRGAALRITSAGVERRASARAAWAPVSLQELRRLHPAGSAAWQWLAEHGHSRPSPSGEGGSTSRVLGGWRVAPVVKLAVATRAAQTGVSESAIVESAILAALGPTS